MNCSLVSPARPGAWPRPLLDRWFLGWAERAEARWRAVDANARYY